VLAQRERLQAHRVGLSRTQPLCVVAAVCVLFGERLALDSVPCKVALVYFKTTAALSFFISCVLFCEECLKYVTVNRNERPSQSFGSLCYEVCARTYSRCALRP